MITIEKTHNDICDEINNNHNNIYDKYDFVLQQLRKYNVIKRMYVLYEDIVIKFGPVIFY